MSDLGAALTRGASCIPSQSSWNATLGLSPLLSLPLHSIQILFSLYSQGQRLPDALVWEAQEIDYCGLRTHSPGQRAGLGWVEEPLLAVDTHPLAFAVSP